MRHAVQLLINGNYNKIREEYDRGVNYLTGIYSTFKLDAEKELTHSSATSAHLMTRSVQFLRHDVCNCTITAQIRVADDESDSRILI